ncbi:MAG: LysM peptidoglycan-binding domain-containing protein [Stappiaceae bacterium]
MAQPKPDFRLAGGIAFALLVVLGIVGYSLGAWTAVKDRFMTSPSEITAQSEKAAVEPPQGVAVVTKEPEAASGSEPTVDLQKSDTLEEAETAAETLGDKPVKPEFDIVRVEPTGETLVAGRSEPGAIIAIISNGEVRGKGVANEAGEWAVVVERPLEPGSHDVLVSAKTSETDNEVVSDERVAVHIPESANEEVLVVVNREGAPSEVLQLPETAANAAESTTKEEKVASLNTGKTVVSGGSDIPSGSSNAAVDTSTSQQEGSEQSVDTETSRGALQPPIAAGDNVKTTEGTSSPTPLDAQSAATGEGAEQNEQAEQTQGVSDQQVAELTPAEEAKTDQLPASEVAGQPSDEEKEIPNTGEAIQTGSYSVAVSAVETEKGKLFVAGEGTAGEQVQIYLGEDLVGSVRSGGNSRWLLETRKDVGPGTYEVRADVVDGGSGKVLARAVVSFKKVPDSVILRPVVTAEQAQGSGAAGASAQIEVSDLPNVIIRKGDNLWTISRRLYGDGLRYTTIYQANKEQIRNPNLIFPGQVFMTPERDLNWKN